MGDANQNVADYCWHHGYEPVTEDTYRVCGECWHAFTAEELLEAHNRLGLKVETDVEAIVCCPLCAHDF